MALRTVEVVVGLLHGIGAFLIGNSFKTVMAAGGGYAFKPRPDGTFDGRDFGVDNAGARTGAELLNRLKAEL